MNENIDLTKILKDCPKGFKLYSAVHGEVEFFRIEGGTYPIHVFTKRSKVSEHYSSGGKLYASYGQCVLFPSEEQQDWSKFTAPWLKSKRFDPKTLKAFDKVLVRDECHERWKCDFYSHIYDNNSGYPYIVINNAYKHCIPYNNDTKHLVGTKDEAPDFYRYWED